MPTETFSSFWNKIASDENFREQRQPPKIMRHDKSKHINSENFTKSIWFSEKFEKSGASAEKKISKFLGNPPSEQIFYRNVPLGAPERSFLRP